eukprot:COSAG02_NODE_46452_length_348_cov_3.863454_1_plen_55_part_01
MVLGDHGSSASRSVALRVYACVTEVGNLRFLVLPPSQNPNSVSGGLTYPTTETHT